MNDNWETYLKGKFGNNIPDGPLKIDLSEIDFIIPPLLGTTVESIKIINKHNAKIGIFQ